MVQSDSEKTVQRLQVNAKIVHTGRDSESCDISILSTEKHVFCCVIVGNEGEASPQNNLLSPLQRLDTLEDYIVRLALATCQEYDQLARSLRHT